MIPYSTQTIEYDDLEAVRDVLTSPFLTCGPKITEFEDKVCTYTGANFAVGVNSCTSALHLAMIALGVSKGDRVFVSAISFVSSSNCARYQGADVDFIDVAPSQIVSITTSCIPFLEHDDATRTLMLIA